MEFTSQALTGTPGAAVLAKSKFEDTRDRLANAVKEMRDHAEVLAGQQRQLERGAQLQQEEQVLLEEVFEGDYGSEYEQQLEELKNYQTWESGEYHYNLEQWQCGISEFAAANAALVAAGEWLQSFIEAAVSTKSTTEAWFVSVHNKGISTIYKALTSAYQHFYKIWKVHLPNQRFEGFGAEDMETLRNLVGIIFSGGQGGGNIDDARADAASVATLCERGMLAQQYAQGQLGAVHAPAAAEAAAHLKQTSLALKEERKLLIQEKMELVTINGKPVKRKKKRDTTAFAGLEAQIAAMQSKLDDTESMLHASNDEAAAVIIKAQEAMEATAGTQRTERNIQQAKIQARLAYRRAGKNAKATAVA